MSSVSDSDDSADDDPFLKYERVTAKLKEDRLRLADPDTSPEELARLDAKLRRNFRSYAENTDDFNILESDTRTFQEYIRVSTDRVRNVARSVHNSKDLRYCMQQQGEYQREHNIKPQDYWSACGKFLAKTSHLPAQFDSLQFVTTAEQKVAATREKVVRNTDAARTGAQINLEDVNSDDQVNELAAEVMETIKEIYTDRGNEPIPFVEAVFNKYSYGQTVENMFLTSIPVANGLLKVYLADAGYLAIEPLENSNKNFKGERQQQVVDLSEPTWRELKDIFPGEPLIAHRTYTHGGTENGTPSNGHEDYGEPTQADTTLFGEDAASPTQPVAEPVAEPAADAAAEPAAEPAAESSQAGPNHRGLRRRRQSSAGEDERPAQRRRRNR